MLGHLKTGGTQRRAHGSLMEKQMMESIDNFVSACIYTYHLDEQEMWDVIWDHAERQVNRLRALDPARNK